MSAFVLDDRVELAALALGHAELREGLVDVVHERVPLRAGDKELAVRVEHRAPLRPRLASWCGQPRSDTKGRIRGLTAPIHVPSQLAPSSCLGGGSSLALRAATRTWS
jgi:hypothetical protein